MKIILFFVLILSFFAAFIRGRRKYTVAFEIELTGQAALDTPEDDVFIIGNHQALGNWKGPGKKFDKIKLGLFYREFKIEKGSYLEYKITRGSWEKEASSPRGRNFDNFRLNISKSFFVTHKIEAWKDFCTHISPGHTLTGHFRSMGLVKSSYLENEREVLVYLPPGYEKGSQRYPVIYFHDGNNVFDEATAFGGREWHVDEVAQYLIKNKIVRPFIAVGVYNTFGREFEYTHDKSPQNRGGGAELYAKFLKLELGPAIEKRFRTIEAPEERGVAGSSFGGLVTLYLGACHGDYFGMAAAVSPSIWWSNRSILKLLKKSSRSKMSKKFWLCMGRREALSRGSRPDFNENIKNHLKCGDLFFPDEAGIKTKKALTPGLRSVYDAAGILLEKEYQLNKELVLCEALEGAHSEPDWAARIHAVLVFLFGNETFDVSKLLKRKKNESYLGQSESGDIPRVEIKKYPLKKYLFRKFF